MKRKKSEKQKKQVRKFYLAIKICAFFAALFVFAVIGLLIPLRPTVSDLEKRTLETFPSFTMASFLDGSYFSGISTWYSDTFPFREKLLSANAGFENLYGIRGEQIVFADSQTTDAATVEATMDDALTEEVTVEEISGDIGSGNAVEESGTETIEIYDENYVDAAIDVEPEAVGDEYITGDTGFELFYDNYHAADLLIDVINRAQADLEGISDIYVLIPPTSVGINLTERAQSKVGSGDQEAFINYIYDGLNSSVKTVSTFDYLKAHDSEYIYFRTDHHWTGLGAYYAYTAFCDVKGITPTPLDSFETVEYSGFLGTLYAGSNQAPSLKENPDTVIAYIPKATDTETYWTEEYGNVNAPIIWDVSDYPEDDKYSAFLGGDMSLAWIENPNLSDGSSCVLVKDSYANAFIPFLIDHYEYIYIADSRHFASCTTYGNSVYDLIADKDIDDVIILINTNNVIESRTALIDDMLH